MFNSNMISQVTFVLALKIAALFFTVKTKSFMLDLDVHVHVSNGASAEIAPVTRIFYPQVLDVHVSRQTLLRCERSRAVGAELPEALMYHLDKYRLDL